ncbi:hypothetical protein [Lactiplantibacillus pentosus]|nr:hypothetical protein [Lactiplantibacillus pentosus]
MGETAFIITFLLSSIALQLYRLHQMKRVSATHKLNKQIKGDK